MIFLKSPRAEFLKKTFFFVFPTVSLHSPYLQDPTQPLRTTEPPSHPRPRAPYTWEGPITVRCHPDHSYQVSVWGAADTVAAVKHQSVYLIWQ